MNKTCYMCDTLATSNEHCPPRSIFPKGHRDQLDSVPSCEAHNTSKNKTKDDEYLKFMLLSAPESKFDTEEHLSSVMRSFQYRPHLVGQFMPNLQDATFKGEATSSFSVDRGRFFRIIGMVVKALYYKDTGVKLSSDVRVAWAPLGDANSGKLPYLEKLEYTERHFGDTPNRKNGEIFQYDWQTSPDKTLNICRLKFYQGLPIYAIWKQL